MEIFKLITTFLDFKKLKTPYTSPLPYNNAEIAKNKFRLYLNCFQNLWIH
jgi:hypothetical protein